MFNLCYYFMSVLCFINVTKVKFDGGMKSH